MNIIDHRVKRRVPGLFLLTVCGLEFPDYGIPVGGVVRKAIPTTIAPMLAWDDEIPTVSMIEQRCLVC